MQKFISKYALAAHLALLAVAPLFLFPFVGEGATATVLLWLSPLMLVWMLMEPSRRPDEMLHNARVRTASAIAVDPLFWFLLAVVALAGIRALNDGVGIAYDAENYRWFLREPTLSIMPGSSPGAGRLPFAASLAVLVVVTGCRHAMGKSARISFLCSCTVFSGLAATAAAVGCVFGHAGCLQATKCALADGSFAGTAFGLHFLGGIAGLAGAYESKWGKYIFFYSFAVGATAAGLYFFSPAPVVMLFGAAGLLLLVSSLAYLGFAKGRNLAFKCVASMVLASVVPVLFAAGFAPAGLNESRLAVLGDGWQLFPDGFLAARNALSSISAKIFREHPWIGTGLGTFALDVRFAASAGDWNLLSPGQASAFNGWWQLTAERGIVGVLLFAIALGFMGYTFFRRLASCFGKSFFVPACALGPIALAAVATETFFDNSLLRPETLAATAAFLALAGSSLPAVRKPQTEIDRQKQES